MTIAGARKGPGWFAGKPRRFRRGFFFGQSGDPTPSRADIETTCTIMDVATPLGIVVHDHIVIDRDGHASMKG